MGKFKVGDRVVVRTDVDNGRDKTYDGSVVVIKEVGEGDYRCNVGDGVLWFFAPEELSPTPDTVNSPSHYQSENGIECIEAIRAQLTPDEFRGYIKGNVAKYVWRERTKGGDESLRKARWYLDYLINVSRDNSSV